MIRAREPRRNIVQVEKGNDRYSVTVDTCVVAPNHFGFSVKPRDSGYRAIDGT
jgi:hypothetical protein